MNEQTQLLIQKEPRLSQMEAEKTLVSILNSLNILIPSKNKQHQYIIKNKGTEQEVKLKYFEILQQIRNNGICKFIQDDLDRSDPVFAGTFGMSTTINNSKIAMEWAGYKKELNGPCRFTPSEIELSEDIEFYKDETCIESTNLDFEMCSRNYRGYLFSSIALIDCYINRHIKLHEFSGHKTERFTELKENTNTEKRIKLFVDEFCNFHFDKLKQSVPWDDFKKLKRLRNEVVHSVNPYLGFDVKETALNLNLSKHGVGSLLKMLQEGQGRISLGFIERVRTSPIISFNQTTLKVKGKHH